MKRILTLFLVLACAWIASGGPLDNGLPVGPSSAGGVTKFPLSPPLTVTPTSITFDSESTTTFQTISVSSPNSGAVTFSSSDPSVAVVGTTTGIVYPGSSTGTAIITVSQASNGSYFSGAVTTVTVTNTAGDPWNWLSFDDVDDGLIFNCMDFPYANCARTVEIWVACATDTVESVPILGYGYKAGGVTANYYRANDFAVLKPSTNLLLLDQYGGNVVQYSHTIDGSFHQYCYSFGVPDSYKLYLDGNPVHSASYLAKTSKPPLATCAVSFAGLNMYDAAAKDLYLPGCGKGKLHGIRVFNYQRSDAEISASYASTTWDFPPSGCILQIRVPNSGSTLVDEASPTRFIGLFSAPIHGSGR